MTNEVKKHPDIIAWDEWKRLNPGIFEGSTSGYYLENRLWSAFMAGRKRGEHGNEGEI